MSDGSLARRLARSRLRARYALRSARWHSARPTSGSWRAARGRGPVLPGDLPARQRAGRPPRPPADHAGFDPAGPLDAGVRRRRPRGGRRDHAGVGRLLADAGADFASAPTTRPTWHGATSSRRRRSRGCTSPASWPTRRPAAATARVGVLGTRITMDGPGVPRGPRRPRHRGRRARRRRRRRSSIASSSTSSSPASSRTRPGRAYQHVIGRLAARGCDAVALACTEIPLLIAPDDSSLPTLDSTRLLAAAALDRAMAPTATGG